MFYLKVSCSNFLIFFFGILSIASLSFSLMFPYYSILFTKINHGVSYKNLNVTNDFLSKETHTMEFYGTFLYDVNVQSQFNKYNQTKYMAKKISYDSYKFIAPTNSVFQLITSMTLTGFIAKVFPIPMILINMYIRSQKPKQRILQDQQPEQEVQQQPQQAIDINNNNNEVTQQQPQENEVDGNDDEETITNNANGADIENEEEDDNEESPTSHYNDLYETLLIRYQECASYYCLIQLGLSIISFIVTLFSTFVVTHRLPITMKLMTSVDELIFMKSLCYGSNDEPFGYCNSFVGYSSLTIDENIVDYKWSPSAGWYLSLVASIFDMISICVIIKSLISEGKCRKPKSPSQFTNLLNLSDLDLIEHRASIRNQNQN